MTSPAEDLRPGELVAAAFGVHDGAIRALIAELNGEPPRQLADALAQKLGLGNRFQLAHLLTREGLPSLTGLRTVIRVVTWVHRWETQGLSLASQALAAGHDPAAWSKTVRHVTRHRWREIRDRGARAVATDMAARSHGGSTT